MLPGERLSEEVGHGAPKQNRCVIPFADLLRSARPPSMPGLEALRQACNLTVLNRRPIPAHRAYETALPAAPEIEDKCPLFRFCWPSSRLLLQAVGKPKRPALAG